MSVNTAADVSAEMVAEYLNQNREFFHVFPNLINEMSIPHPKTGQEISLLERQVFQLREQRDALQVEVDTLKDIAGENGQLLQKVYQFADELMRAETDQQAVDTVYGVMQQLFEVEQVSLMSWDVPNASIEGLNQLGISQDWSQALKSTLSPERPVCGLLEDSWQKGLFATYDAMRSVCLIPLGTDKVWGVLALGATTDRFSPDLGTYFLKVMGSLMTARLQRLFS